MTCDPVYPQTAIPGDLRPASRASQASCRSGFDVGEWPTISYLNWPFPFQDHQTEILEPNIFSHTQYASMAATELDTTAIAIAKGLEHTPWCDDYEKMISGVLSVPLSSVCTESQAN